MKKSINGITTEEYFAQGHRACAGCGPAIAMRYALKAAGKNTIVAMATGCMEVATTPFPETSWRVPWIHAAFENAASVASGINRALKTLKRRDKTNLLVIGGDGGTFDIGFQFISGAFERGEQLTYICYDNEAYMNTGIQRSGSTPKFASTTTSPYGKKVHGKQQNKKPLPLIFAAHGAYVATANIAYPQDFIKKVQKALSVKGPSYIQIFAPCPTGWKFPPAMTVEVAKKAYQTGVSPLYEIENGIVKFSMKPAAKKPVEEYLKMQKRFAHLTQNEIREIQKKVDEDWQQLEKLEEYQIRI